MLAQATKLAVENFPWLNMTILIAITGVAAWSVWFALHKHLKTDRKTRTRNGM